MPTRDEMRRGLLSSKFIEKGMELIEVPPGLQLNKFGEKEHDEELVRKGQRKLDDLERHRLYGRRT